MRKQAKGALWPGRGLSSKDIRSAAKRIAEAAPTAQESDNRLRDLGRRMALSARDRQVGGDHYAKLAIQPMRYSMENGLNALQHTIIKYVTRYKDKGGIEDLHKAAHSVELLIQHELDEARKRDQQQEEW